MPGRQPHNRSTPSPVVIALAVAVLALFAVGFFVPFLAVAACHRVG